MAHGNIEGLSGIMTKVVWALALLSLALAAWTFLASGRAASRFPPQGVSVPVAGGRLHLRDMGPRDAPPSRIVVMVHGASCNHMALMLPLAEPLVAAGFRVIAIDRPGHGHSDRPGGRADASPVRQAALIAEAMRAVGAPEAIVLAHSFAGAIGTVMAINHPGQVKALALIAPVSHPWPGGVTWYNHPGSWPVVDLLFSNTLPVAGFSLTAQAGVDSVFAPQAAPAGYIDATQLPLMLRPANFRANAQDMTGLAGHIAEWSTRYGEIRQPVTLISGDRDTIVSTTIHTEQLARQLPDARKVILPGVGHVPHHADTGLVVREVLALAARLTR
jgi:pimeloyl-ACP methyl ester carboxylesterase